MLPWIGPDRRFSPLKAACFAALLVPGVAIASAYVADALGPRPMTEVIHETGLWAIRLLFASLAVTPLRQLLRWPRLAFLRRMIGVAAFAYGALHLVAYAADQSFDLAKVASEIVLRFYLAIGFVALLALLALALSSTDGAMRRLGGRRWRRLHRLAYLVALLATAHFFIQSKADIGEPLVMAGLGCWLLGYRLLPRSRAEPSRPALGSVALLGAAAALAVALGEAGYFWLARGVDPLRLLPLNLSLSVGLRPAAAVTLILAGVIMAALARTRFRGRTARPAPALADSGRY